MARTANVLPEVALVPQLLAAAAVEVDLARPPGERQRLGVHPGQREDLAGMPVLHDARDEPALVECHVGVVHGPDSRWIRWRASACDEVAEGWPPRRGDTGGHPGARGDDAQLPGGDPRHLP